MIQFCSPNSVYLYKIYENTNFKKCMHSTVHQDIIYNSQYMKTI